MWLKLTKNGRALSTGNSIHHLNKIQLTVEANFVMNGEGRRLLTVLQGNK